ncbi:hypothetical protein ONS95_008765 [Cadophora gregata]|uniref:uncharacterized protein n=1 Tax=Cadophora gregata TaxID=51156 RepID=UPI0026DA8424|nr:uncharacterized protein ONS95_008765 [Cadophora gregata]KAK0123758.1 hypothetical protein ONS95_008765 [Cadophora gregata]KAK0130101.1 hypothetical protein ONS96_000635 [Cadophora gregata f. sp. sojae]
MSHQPPLPTTVPHQPSLTSSKLVPKPAASENFNPKSNHQSHPSTQTGNLSNIVETSTETKNKRATQKDKSSSRAGTACRSPTRPVITLTESSISTMNTERGERNERGTERGRQPGPSVKQPSPPNRLSTAAGTVDRRPSTRKQQHASFQYEQSHYPPEAASARLSLLHTTTSESMRRKEASYYGAEDQVNEGTYYGGLQTAVPHQAEHSLARSRRYSPRRASPPPLAPPGKTNNLPSRSNSRSPPLSERLTVFHKPISFLPAQLQPSLSRSSNGPAHSPSPADNLSARDADRICDDLVRKVRVAQLGKMYDRAVEADRRGLVDDGLYDMVMDFFYRFLPMVWGNGESDPIIINRRQILDHQRVWQIFGPRGEGLSRKDRGKNRPHPWYTRPKDRKMSLKEVAGEVLDSL